MMTASSSPAADPGLCRQVAVAWCVTRGQHAAAQERRWHGAMHATGMHDPACMHTGAVPEYQAGSVPLEFHGAAGADR